MTLHASPDLLRIVAPAKPSARRKKFDAAQEWAHKRYGKAFRKLDLVLSVAAGGLSKPRLIEIFESRCNPSEGR